MHDARDAEDTRLLEAGEYGLLVEGYYGVILDRSSRVHSAIHTLSRPRRCLGYACRRLAFSLVALPVAKKLRAWVA